MKSLKAALSVNTSDNFCEACPGRIADLTFHGMNWKYNYEVHPAAFLAKLEKRGK